MAALALALVLAWAAPADAAPLLGTKGAGDDADKWLLSDAEVVMTINFKQMTGSAIMKANLPMLKELIKNHEQVKTLLEATGLDPFKDVDSILISGSGTQKDAKALVVVKGRFDTDKIHAALKKEADKKGDVELVTEGGKQLYQLKAQDHTMYAGFASKSVMVLTQSKESTVDAIKNGGQKVAKVGKEMKAALNKFTGKETLTLAMVVNDEMKKQLEKAPQVGRSAAKLQTLTASLTVTDSVSLNVTGNTSEAKAADQLSRGLTLLKVAAGAATDDLPPVVTDILDAIKISAEKQSVIVALKITKDMIDKAAKLGGDK
jgi:hypothetical protein